MLLNNIWTNRRKNAWVFVELILITFLAFFFADAYITAAYTNLVAKMTDEVDRDRIVSAPVGYIDERPQDYILSCRALKNVLAQMPEVESASPMSSYTMFSSAWANQLFFPSDSNVCAHVRSVYWPKEYDAFSVLGGRLVDGCNADSVFDNMGTEGVLITRDLAVALFGTEDAVGRQLVTLYSPKMSPEGYISMEETHYTYTIRGVTPNIVFGNERYAYSCFFVSDVAQASGLTLRLKEGVDVDAFVGKFNLLPIDERPMHNGLFPCELTKLSDILQNRGSQEQFFDQIVYVLLGVFLINVFIGTIGTYWIQIRRRRDDISIMRSFGASRGRIVAMLLGEGALLTMAAWLIACVIRLQFSADSLFNGSITCYTGNEVDIVTQFWPHFLIISAFVYIIVYAVVALAILIPSIHLTRQLQIEN